MDLWAITSFQIGTMFLITIQVLFRILIWETLLLISITIASSVKYLNWSRAFYFLSQIIDLRRWVAFQRLCARTTPQIISLV
eukprot:20609_5